MSATPHSAEVAETVDEHLVRGEPPKSEAGGFPEPPESEPEPQADDLPSQADADEQAEEAPDPDERVEWLPEEEVPAGEEHAPEERSEAGEQQVNEKFTRDIPGGAGHGPARAYGYIAIASALGAEAELTEGGTRSTSRNPLKVTVKSDAETFSRVNSVYDEASPVAEQHAAVKRDEARKSGRSFKSSYDVSLLTRATIAGFLQGVAAALREPGTTRPRPLREATRARLVDENAHRSAVSSGRAWAIRTLPAAQREHSAV